ncbi:MAG TPA: permease [Gemmataceae bacterium]|nr:permease [Gemmataceae bacterium]
MDSAANGSKALVIPIDLWQYHAAINIPNLILIFMSILLEAMPFIVLGAIIAGLLEELVPQKLITRLLPRSRFLSIAIGGLLGLIFPMCECGIIPVMRRLLRKGLPVSCCTAYLLAGPIINVVVMLSTFMAFQGKEGTPVLPGMAPQMGGWWMMGLRMGLGYLVAIGTSLIVDWQYRKYGNKLLTPLATPSSLPLLDEDAPERRRSLWERMTNIVQTSLHDFVDIMVFLILGGLIAALTRQLVPQNAVAAWSKDFPYLAILIMMGLAVVLCLCSEADAFVAASYATMRPAAKLAFLVLGPMLDFKLYFMYTRVFRPRLIYTIFLSVIVQTFVYAMVVHVIWDGMDVRVPYTNVEIRIPGYGADLQPVPPPKDTAPTT